MSNRTDALKYSRVQCKRIKYEYTIGDEACTRGGRRKLLYFR